MNNPYSAWKVIIYLAIAFLLTNCGTGKKVARINKIKKKPTVPLLVNYLKSNRVEEGGMTARAKIKYRDEAQSVSASLTIKWVKDSVLWMSIRKLGFEVARTQITKDSVYLINRLNRTYAILPLSYVEDNYGIPAAFPYIEDFMLGNAILFPNDELSIDENEDQIKLKAKGDTYFTQYEIDRTDVQLRRINIQDLQKADKSVSMGYEDYQTFQEDQFFSYLRTINAVSEEFGRINVELNYSKVEFVVPKNISFEISNRYTREVF